MIDFQDALLAPAAQDLAVLLTTRDTGRVIGPEAERRLLDYYIAGLARRGAPCPDADEFINSYHLCVLQHALKVIGRFNALERQGKPGYAAFIPHAAAQARRMLAILAGPRRKMTFPDCARPSTCVDAASEAMREVCERQQRIDEGAGAVGGQG